MGKPLRPRITKVGGVEGRGNLFGPNISQNGIARKWPAGNAEEYRSSNDNSIPSNSKLSTLSYKPDQVHLLARIFLGSVCLIWSGLSQLGFLTGGSGGTEKGNDGLGSFMAAMGYDVGWLGGGGRKEEEM